MSAHFQAAETVSELLLQVCDGHLCDEIKSDRFKKEVDSQGAEGALISSRSQIFVRVSRPLTILIWRLPPFTTPLISFLLFILSVQQILCLFFSALYCISLFLSPPPTRAPSPLFSRRLISGAASQQAYLRNEKASLLSSLFLTPLSYISLHSCLHLSSIFFSL